jgi:hypothetical protein
MNLIDVISYNNFLKSLFPDGMDDNVLIGKLSLELGGRFGVSIHTKQRPAKEIPKWGKWGVDYNVIVIHLLGGKGETVNIKNWNDIEYSKMCLKKCENGFSIQHSGVSHDIYFLFDTLTFQSCSTYIDGGTENI